MIGREALRGVVLEEVLARLLQDNGYKLLVSADQDPEVLEQDKHSEAVGGCPVLCTPVLKWDYVGVA